MRCIPSSRAKGHLPSPKNRTNDKIDKGIYLDFLRAKNEINILVVGAGEAERQLMLLHPPGPGLSVKERGAYKEAIFSNIVQSMRAILEAMRTLGISLDPQNDTYRTAILSLPRNVEADVLPRDIAHAVRGLWRDPGVKEAFNRRNEYQLYESTVYYFNAIDRIAAVDYVPSDRDILRCRFKARGVQEIRFQIGELTYKISNMHSQRLARRKWLHCFENVKAIIFCADLTQYDQMIYEDESVSLQEALTFFDSICNSRWFSNTNIILFLNIDGLFEKLSRSPLADYFPDYTGGDNHDAACDYLLNQFISLNQSAGMKQIYAHYTSTTDTQQIQFIVNTIQDIILKLRLREYGLLDPPLLASESSFPHTSDDHAWIAALEARYSAVA
ncbi:G-protein alpha subunit [Mycena sanguinolenta]|uniref:G-protein alpha subunit n=1 Tax=Mycena sanguinolenta TaxID=230812 RepID=A0A8H6YNP4_9AGAR|nr:G-protein alpha subunit [Mycena sanguinolenta]